MTAIGSDAVLTAFVLFCRIGGCLMLMPGYSSQRVPLNVRLFIAFSVTLALTPILSSEIEKHLSGIAPAALTRLFISEMLIGALIGFLARIFFGALETLAGVIAMSIGLTSVLASPVEENEPLPAIATFNYSYGDGTYFLYGPPLGSSARAWRFLFRAAGIRFIRRAI